MVCQGCGAHIEGEAGVCPHGCPPEPVVPAGCENCLGPSPVVCEGFCVHCGREIIPRGDGSGESHSGTPAMERAIAGNLTYFESLSVAWLLVWRGAAITGTIGLVIGLLAGNFASEIPRLVEVVLGVLAIALAGFFLVLPSLLRMMMKKQFRRFSIVVARNRPSVGN